MYDTSWNNESSNELKVKQKAEWNFWKQHKVKCTTPTGTVRAAPKLDVQPGAGTLKVVKLNVQQLKNIDSSTGWDH